MKELLTDVVVMVNTIDFTALARHVEVHFEYELVDVTTYGSTTRAFRPGVPEAAEVGLEFFVDPTISGPLDGPVIGPTLLLPFTVGDIQEYVLVTIKPSPGSTSATNPAVTGACSVVRYVPLEGDVGDPLLMRLDLKSVGALQVQRS